MRNNKLIALALSAASIVVIGCNSDASRGPSDGCEEALRNALPILHEHVKSSASLTREARIAEQAAEAPTRAEIARALAAQESLASAQWALSMTSTAFVQARLYGGDSSRNAANEQDGAQASTQAAEAVALLAESAPEEIGILAATLATRCPGN